MILFDIETNGLLDKLDRIHCLCMVDTETGIRSQFADQEGYKTIREGLWILANAKEIAAHNAFAFDIPAILKVYPKWYTHATIDDTLVLARLMYPHIRDIDLSLNMVKLNGSHSLAAWGQRLGTLKGDFGKTTDWENWTKEMQDYCALDVEVLYLLWQKLSALNYPRTAIELEYEFAKEIKKQEDNGIDFNVLQAEILLQTLQTAQEEIQKTASKSFPEREVKTTIVPKRDNIKRGYLAGIPFTKTKREPINLGSRQQIIDFFKSKYKWEPAKLTDKGNAILDAEVFSDLHFPEAKIVEDYLNITKCIGQLSAGANSLLNYVYQGRIHGGINHNGARTGRCVHYRPNIGQVQSPKKIFGKEFRQLFIAPAGRVFVGTDLKAIELRMLAHYLHQYDQGRYATILLEKDIHTDNQQAAGLETRDQAKRFIFAFNYGAGDQKLGSIINPVADEVEQKQIGRTLRGNFLAKCVGMEDLIFDVKHTFKVNGYLRGLDGRRLVPRAQYNALNTLLQGGAAVLAKKWTCLIHNLAEEAGIDILQHIHCHDEVVLSCHEPNAETMAKLCELAAIEAGKFFNINLPIEAEAKIGLNWYDVH